MIIAAALSEKLAPPRFFRRQRSSPRERHQCCFQSSARLLLIRFRCRLIEQFIEDKNSFLRQSAENGSGELHLAHRARGQG